jgi:hypothetical protein
MKIRATLKKAADYLRHGYWLTAWRWRQRLRVLTFWLRNASAWLKRFLILAASLLLARLVLVFIDVSRLQADVMASYFIAVGAMVGSILAIVFSISIFAQQSSTDLSSSGYFEDYTRGWNEKLIYLLVVVTTLLFFALGLLFNGRDISGRIRELAIYASLMLIGLVFVLIDWHYQNCVAKAEPARSNFLP